MNKIALIFVLIVLFFESRAQHIIAGTSGAIYYDIIPDTLLNPPPQLWYSVTKNYNIDINQDGSNDIRIEAQVSISNTTDYYWVKVRSLNQQTTFMQGGYMDTTFCSPPTTYTAAVSKVLKVFNLGDSIKRGVYDTLGYLAYRYSFQQPGPPYYGCGIRYKEWLNRGDKYFGIRYKTNTDSAYGWVKVNVMNDDEILIKEFSLEKSIAVGIEENKDLSLIYPNPTTGIFIIETQNKVAQPKITNLIGEEIIDFPIKTQESKTEIDLSAVPNGIYFVKVKTPKGEATKKIIVQH